MEPNFDDQLENVVDFLLHNQFHLAALELRQELQDVSLTAPPGLDNFFCNPQNALQFVTNPSDMTASSDLPKGMLPDFAPPFGPLSTHSVIVARDERIALLEYEHRIAREKHSEELSQVRASDR